MLLSRGRPSCTIEQFPCFKRAGQSWTQSYVYLRVGKGCLYLLHHTKWILNSVSKSSDAFTLSSTSMVRFDVFQRLNVIVFSIVQLHANSTHASGVAHSPTGCGRLGYKCMETLGTKAFVKHHPLVIIATSSVPMSTYICTYHFP